MSVSEQRAQIEQVWAKTFRQTRQATQVVERQLQQEEQALQAELAQPHAAACTSAVIGKVEKTLSEKEARFEKELRALKIALLPASMDVDMRGVNAMLLKQDESWAALGIYIAEIADHMKEQMQIGAGNARKPMPPAPKIDETAIEAIAQITGPDSPINRLLRSFDDILPSYARRKLRRRILFHAWRVLLFLVLLGFVVEFLLSLIQPLAFYLLAAVAVWFVDDYFIHPRLDRILEQKNLEALQHTISDFYRAQRTMLYLRAAFNIFMKDAQTVLAQTEASYTEFHQQA